MIEIALRFLVVFTKYSYACTIYTDLNATEVAICTLVYMVWDHRVFLKRTDLFLSHPSLVAHLWNCCNPNRANLSQTLCSNQPIPKPTNQIGELKVWNKLTKFGVDPTTFEPPIMSLKKIEQEPPLDRASLLLSLCCTLTHSLTVTAAAVAANAKARYRFSFSSSLVLRRHHNHWSRKQLFTNTELVG